MSRYDDNYTVVIAVDGQFDRGVSCTCRWMGSGDGGIHERAFCELILLMMVVARRLGAREVCVCSPARTLVSDRSTTSLLPCETWKRIETCYCYWLRSNATYVKRDNKFSSSPVRAKGGLCKVTAGEHVCVH
jgi:hypothetical protein